MKPHQYPLIEKIKPNILIVDDDEPLRTLLRDVFVQEGMHTIALASDGLEAIELLNPVQDRAFHVAFVDVVMPGLDGFGVLRYIKEHRPEIKVIMITAYKDLKLGVEAKRLGASSFVAKPLMRRDLLQTLEDALAG